MAIALQIQVSLFTTDEYLGLRINLADFLLPIAGLYVFYSLITQKSTWPKWRLPYAWLWIGGLISVFSISLWHGYSTNGFFSNWALINKYTGFVILIAYFALGGWVSSQNQSKNISFDFSQAFLLFVIGLILISIWFLVAVFFFDFDLKIWMVRWEGLMGNRNAFLCTFVFALILIECFNHYDKNHFKPWFYHFIWALIPVFMLYNASRTGWVVVAVIALVTTACNAKNCFKEKLPGLLIGLCLAAFLFYLSGKASHIPLRQFERLKTTLSSFETIDYKGDQNRLISFEDGLDLFSQSSFLFGSGLGTYREFQKEKRGEFIDIIDCSPLWLLVETGLIGLLAFGGFFLCCLITLYKTGLKAADPFRTSVFFFLIAMIAMSFCHELLYTRFMWFALGLALCVPNNKAN